MKSFSAVAFFFGRKLHNELNVPIGLIVSPRGGSYVEAWISDPILRKDFPEFTRQLDTYPDITRKTGGVFDHRKKSKVHGVTQKAPAALYNVRVHPFVPYAIRGVIWYQGESNVGKPEQYRKLFPAMIRQWRQEWGQGDFPFCYVQIAPCGRAGISTAYLREAQMMAMSEPNTGMAVTMDVGEPGNIHPPRKKPVGERLALWALANDYGRDELVYSGPHFTKSAVEGATMRLHFDHDDKGISEAWFKRSLSDSIELPGTTDENRKGEENPERKTSHLTRVYPYVGPAFYQRNIHISPELQGKNLFFIIERTKHSTVWVDSNLVGERDSLCTPHVYDITHHLAPGDHRITVRVDNGNLPPLGDGHQISEHTQTNWNGLLGKIEIQVRDTFYFEDVQAYPDVHNRQVKLCLKTNISCTGELSVSASVENSD